MQFVGCWLCGSLGCLGGGDDTVEAEEEIRGRYLIIITYDEQTTAWCWIARCSRGRKNSVSLR